jgi:hypothetical protein
MIEKHFILFIIMCYGIIYICYVGIILYISEMLNINIYYEYVSPRIVLHDIKIVKFVYN